MRGKSMILIVIALGCGLVASIGISKILDRQQSGPKDSATKKIYVTVKNIDIAQVVDKEMIKLEEWPADRVPEGAISKLEDVVGLAPTQRLYAGEVVRKEKLVSKEMAAGRSQLIPKGYRVQAIKVRSESVVGNIVTPGDHVDIQVYLRKSASVPLPTTKTILEDVRVFAVNSETEKQVDSDGQKINAKTVSLLVKPDQLQTLLLASRLGDINLSLRHPDDDTETISDNGAGLNDLLHGVAESGTPKDEMPPPAAEEATQARSDFADFLKNLTPPAGEQPTVVEEPDQSEFLVQLILPDGITTFGLVNDEQISQAQVKNTVDPVASGQPADLDVPASDQPFVDPDGPPVTDDINSDDDDDSTAETDDDA